MLKYICLNNIIHMELKYIDESLKKQWDDLVKNNPASGYMQSFWWADVQNLLGWETYKIGIFNREKLLGGAIIAKYNHFKNKSILYIGEGPVLPYEEPVAEEMFKLLMSQIDTIAEFDGSHPTSHISIEPKLLQVPAFFSRFQRAQSDRQPLSTLMIDLQLSEEEILKQMKPKGRYNIKISQKNGVVISRIPPSRGFSDFLKLYLPFVKRSGFDGKDRDYFERLNYILSEEGGGEYFFASYKGKVLAVALVIYFGNTATYLFGASSDENRQVMAPYGLHGEIIRFAKKSGYHWYDWYGISPGENTTQHPWDGFSVFKKKFGGKQVNYIGAYDFIYNKNLYLPNHPRKRFWIV